MGKRLTKKEKQKLNNFACKNWWLIGLLIIIIAGIAIFGYYEGWWNKWLKKANPDNDFNPTGKNSTTEVSEILDVEITFLDVGQGDCIILELPDGKNMIVDAGDLDEDYARVSIDEFTEKQNITSFDYLLLTHQDADHAGQMDWVIDNYDIGYIFRPNVKSTHKNAKDLPTDFNQGDGEVSTSATYANFLVAAYNEKCDSEIFDKDSDFINTVVCGEESVTYSINFLTPVVAGEDAEYNEHNDYSPLFIFEYAGRKILFSGDAGITTINEYLENYPEGHNIDVFKVSHHGSKNNITLAWIETIDPEYAIIQCGEGNSHTHPDEETLRILYAYDSDINLYRNDTNGNIVLKITKDGVMIFTLEQDNLSNNWVDGTGVRVA